MHRAFAVALMAFSLSAAEKRVITPADGVPPVGPYSPGILVGDYLYVSGQGAAKPDGSFPSTTEEQTTQTLINVRRIVEAAGLTMQHIVYAHVYLKNVGGVEDMNKAWRVVFPKDPPARVVLGVEKMPVDTPVEVTVVAVRDLASRRVVQPGPLESRGVLTSDRLYISGSPSVDAMGDVLKAAGLDLRHLAFVNPYLTPKASTAQMNADYAKHFEFGNTPARATIQVKALPGDAPVLFTGVAARDLSKRRAVRPKNMAPSPTASPCVFIGETLFCSAKSGFIPGPNSGIYASTVETQLRQTMRNLLDGLEEDGLTFENVVATNVYLDDVGEFARMNKVYAEYFRNTPPTRTTIQQVVSVDRKASANDRWPTLEQISLIAVK
jgi:enamine deaminase RidA (YjgF/YER057c/UK114 family)